MLAFASAIPHVQAADFDFVPLLFVAYVIYAIVSALVKAARQAQAAQATIAQAAPQAQQMTADQVRATLALRRAAAARVRPTAPPPAAPVVVRLTSQPSAPPAGAATVAQMDALAPMSYSDSLGNISGSMDLSALLRSLPPAAQAIVASAVIGPCAAHRGGGHNPEDW